MGPRRATNTGMRCASCRDTLSAMLDGEELPEERAMAQAHVTECTECSRFVERSAHVTRLARTELVEPLADLSLSLRDVIDQRPSVTRFDWLTSLRVLLAAIGVGQLGLVTGELLASAGHDDAPAGIDGATLTHFSHESSAWNLALAVGFLCAAVRPSRTRGLVPLVAAFVCGVMTLSVVDLVGGRVGGSRMLSHGVAVLGLVTLLALTRAMVRRPGGSPDALADDLPEPLEDRSISVVATRSSEIRRDGSDDLKPTARHDAA